MSKWSFWEWVAYAGLFVAAVIIAADQGIKMEPDLLRSMGSVISSPIWAFSPVTLVVMATLILLGREFGRIEKHKDVPLTNPSQATIESPSKKTAPQEQAQEKVDWEFIDGADPDHLWGFFKDRMDAEAQRLIEPYIKQPTTIKGRIRNVVFNKQFKFAQVYLVQPEPLVRTIVFHFAGEESKNISIVPQRTLVEITGQIETVGPHDCVLMNCKFKVIR